MKNYHLNYFSFDPSRDIVWQEIIVYLEKYLPKSQKVLDLGAGYCNFINFVKADHKVAIDIWPQFKRYAKSDVNCYVYDIRSGLRKILKTKFDLIMASNLLEHLSLKEIQNLLNDLKYLLSAKGHLILIQPNYTYSYQHYFDDYTHKTIFTDKSLTHLLLENNYKIIRSESKFTPLTFKSNLPKWRWLTRLYLNLPVRPFAGQMLIIASKT